MTIDLPLPNKLLHPNARPHYMAKAREIRKARDRAQFVARTSAQKRSFVRPVLSIDFHLSRKRDIDGLVAWVKAYIDGFQDAGLFQNDADVELGYVRRHKADKMRTKVIFTIQEHGGCGGECQTDSSDAA